jgi:hypothetical protein
MSTCYKFTEPFTRKQVEKAVKTLGFTMPPHEHNSATQFLVTDGNSYVWADCAEDGSDCQFTRYGGNYAAEEDILEPIATELDTVLMNEHEDGFFEDNLEDEEE